MKPLLSTYQVTHLAWPCLRTLSGCRTGRATSSWDCRRPQEHRHLSASMPASASSALQGWSSYTLWPSQVREQQTTSTSHQHSLHEVVMAHCTNMSWTSHNTLGYFTGFNVSLRRIKTVTNKTLNYSSGYSLILLQTTLLLVTWGSRHRNICF